MFNRFDKLSLPSLWVNGKFQCLIDAVKINSRIIELTTEREDYYRIFASSYKHVSYQLGISDETTAVKAMNSYLSETTMVSDNNANSTKTNIILVSDYVQFVRPKDIPPKCKDCYSSKAITHDKLIDLLGLTQPHYLNSIMSNMKSDKHSYDVKLIRETIRGHFPNLKDQFEKLLILL